MGQPQWQLGELGSGGWVGLGVWRVQSADCLPLPLSLDPLFCLLPWQLHSEWGWHSATRWWVEQGGRWGPF